VHIAGGESDTAEDVAAAHHDADLRAFARHVGDFLRKVADAAGVQPKRLRPGQGFTTELEKNPFVFGHAEFYGSGYKKRGQDVCPLVVSFKPRLPADREAYRRL